MGEVFLGVLQGTEGISTPVVIKRIRPEFALEESFRTMFRDEARALSFVRHPNVVQVIEFGAERDELFLAMEYVEGESATTLLRAVRKADTSVPLAVAVHIVAQAAAGLHAAHEQRDDAGEPLNLVHRDVSPQNIIVTYAGMAKLIDFGIAKTAQQDTLTRTGELKGKYGYMAPEQFMEMPLDRRVDIFALGVVLFELVAARRLFKRANAHSAMRAICDEPYPEPSLPDGREVPSWLVRVMKRALARDPDKRYASAQELGRDLRLGLRELDPESRVEEELPKLMVEYFSDRRATKRQLMSAVREGSIHEVGAAAEAVGPTPSGASLSAVAGAKAARGMAPPQLAPAPPGAVVPKTGRWGVALVLLSACVIGGLAAWFGVAPLEPEPLAGSESSAESVGETPSAVTPSAVTQSAETPSETPSAEHPLAAENVAILEPSVQESSSIHADTRPSGASVYLAGELQGQTPLDLEVEEAGPLTLTFRKPGYVSLEEEIDVQGQVQVNFVLQRRRRTSMGMTGMSSDMATMSSGGDFARFD